MLGISILKLTRQYKDGRENPVYVAQQGIQSIEYVERFNSTAIHFADGTIWVKERPEDFMEAVYQPRGFAQLKTYVPEGQPKTENTDGE